MRTTTTRARRRVAVTTTAVLALSIAGLVAAPIASTAPPGAGVGNPQDGAAGQFDGYNGYVGDGATGAASSPASDTRTKSADPTLADADEVRGTDVPGTSGAAETAPTGGDWQPPTAPDASSVATVRRALSAHGRARVIVMTDAEAAPETALSAGQVRAQRAAISTSLDRLGASLEGTGSRRLSRLTSVPAATYSVTPGGLNALLRNPDVSSVVLDGQVSGDLATSTGVIDSDLLNSAGVLGNGFDGGPGQHQVAIIDSGVDSGHSAFAGRIVAQGCWVTDGSCPGGTNTFIGSPGGEECTHSSDCDHGTHVGGIAAGSSFAGGHEGVARGAGVMAFKVAQDNPSSSRWTAFFSSINSALQHALNLRNGAFPRLRSVNMSIGTNATFGAADPACDAVSPATVNLMQQLQAAGVAVVVAAGNNGSSTSMSFPGCGTGAMAIGATSDADVPAGFTNSSGEMRWWAPGVSIDAPVPSGTNHGFKDGTSMAAPHVAGAFALLRECVDGNGIGLSNAAAAARLDATGVNVTRNGVTRKRINVLDAATGTVNNNDFATPETIPANPGAGFNDFDFTVCSDTEPGEPGPFSLDNGIWWQWTPSATGTATISTEDGGGFATTFDTTLAVYTGNSLGTLSTVAFDDDSGTGLRSSVTFPVNGGTTYRIKVDGFAAANGLLNLHVQNGPPPTCFGVPATMVGTTGNDVLNGTAGNDVIVAGTGNDTIHGNGGNDRICSDAGNDTVNGHDGDDFVLGGSGSDTINGHAGNDTLVGNPGGGSNDDAGDVIRGHAGNDWLDGWFGDDTLDGGPGNDAVRGEAGIDRALYTGAPAGVTVDLTAGTATGGAGSDSVVLVEHLTGSPFADVLGGSAAVNSILGGGGNDRLTGLDGNDVLVGGPGRDIASGGNGHDQVRGEGGNDNLSGNAGNDALNGGSNRDRCVGGSGTDAGVSCETRIGIP